MYKPANKVSQGVRDEQLESGDKIFACGSYGFINEVAAFIAGRPGAMSEMKDIACRAGCGACCIAPSISSSIPGMPNGKPAGVRCIQLDAHNRCMIFGKTERPRVCQSLQASSEMCGDTREHALHYLTRLDQLTS